MSQTQDCIWENNRSRKQTTVFGKIIVVTNTGLSMGRKNMSQTQEFLWADKRCHKHKTVYRTIIDVTSTGLPRGR